MRGKDFISEESACSIAGVSAKTLARFAEAGYLQVEQKQGGSKMYLSQEIRELFGIMDQTFYDKLAQDLSSTPDSLTETALKDIEQTNRAEVMDSSSSLIWDDEPALRTVEPAPQTPNTQESDKELKQELLRLRNLMQIQEKILDLKDQQIAELSQERDWLRARIEKLEQKGERDQLLLLSEAQTVRRLVMLNESRGSPIRAALEWLGIISPAKLALEERPAIESQRAAND